MLRVNICFSSSISRLIPTHSLSFHLSLSVCHPTPSPPSVPTHVSSISAPPPPPPHHHQHHHPLPPPPLSPSLLFLCDLEVSSMSIHGFLILSQFQQGTAHIAVCSASHLHSVLFSQRALLILQLWDEFLRSSHDTLQSVWFKIWKERQTICTIITSSISVKNMLFSPWFPVQQWHPPHEAIRS